MESTLEFKDTLMIILNIIVYGLILCYFIFKNRRSSFLNRYTIYRYVFYIAFAVVAVLVAYLIEEFVTTFFLFLFSGCYTIYDGNLYWNNQLYEIIFNILEYIILVGFIEELVKHLPVYLYNKNAMFGQLSLKKYDFIIPFLTVGIVFSIIENAIYFKDYTTNAIYLRILTSLAFHILFSFIMAFGNYKYAVKSNALSICYKLKNKNVDNIHIISGLKHNQILLGSFFLVSLLHGIFDFLLSTYPTIGLIFIGCGLVCFIVIMITLRNKSFKEDVFNRFLNDNKNLTIEEVKSLLECE